MKTAWHRLGTPDAISRIGVAAVIVQQLAGVFAAPLATVEGRYLELVLLRSVALGVTVLGLFLGKRLLVRFAQQRPLPLLTLSVFVLASTADIALYDVLVQLAGFSDSAQLWQRLVLAIPGRLTILIVSALLVAYARDLARSNQLLASTAAELLATRSDAAERLARRKSTLLSSIREEISDAIAAVTRDQPASAVDAMRGLIDDVVRPMSYRLLNESTVEDATKLTLPEPKVSWSQILVRAVSGNPMHPIAVSAWLGALMGVFLATSFGAEGLLGAGVYAVWLLLAFAVGRVSWRLLPRRVPATVRAALFSAFAIAAIATPTPVVSQISGYDLVKPTTFIGWMIVSFLITLSITLISSINAELRSTHTELELAVDELKREVITLNSQYRLLQKGVARVLHGPVQDAISVAIAKQRTAPEQSPAETLLDIVMRIDGVLQTIPEGNEPTASVEQTFAEIIELWQGIVSIELAASPSVLRRIDADPYARFSVVEVVREACGNAIRHGHARHIWIRIDGSTSDGVVVLHVDNDGKPMRAKANAGLGTELLNEVCLDWSRRQIGALVWLEARIPLAT